jgi:hypothetical protein
MWEAVGNWFKTYESIAVWAEGIALVAIFFLDWREYRKQGADRIEQHKESAAQMEIMQSHADAARDNATIAKEGAEAARANAEAAKLNADAGKAMLELIISKERARIRVEMKELDLSSIGIGASAVQFKVHLYGASEARITDSGGEAYIAASTEPGPRDSYMLSIGLTEVMTPLSPVVEKSAFFMPVSHLDTAAVDSIRKRKTFVHFRGFIKYKDIFDKERETRFQYLWNVTEWAILGKPGEFYSYWSKCGTGSDNVET